MTPSIQSFLTELYEIDPDLRAHEAELIPLIELLLKNNPGTEPDEAFVTRLRMQLRERASSLTEHRSSPLSRFLTMTNLSYAFGGAVAAVLITVPAVYYATHGLPGIQTGAPESAPLFTYSVTDTSPNAFGDLSNVQTAGGRGGAGGGGGMGGDAQQPMADGATTEGYDATNRAQSDKMMIYPPEGFTQYTYVYEGELPALEESVGVLKREKKISGPAIESLASAFNVGLLDLKSFAGARVDNITFTQDKQYGYMVGVSMTEGMVSVNQNWMRWPNPTSKCRDEACYNSFRIKPSDIPADDVLIGLARDFIGEYNVDTSHYGEPEVDKNWMREYERATDKSQAYVPETVNVLFPLLVDDQPVYDQSGNKTGLSVGISVRDKRVASLWGLQNQNYTRSTYTGVTDAAAIKDYLKNVNSYPIDTMLRDAKVTNVSVTLGEPTVGYALSYSYDESKNESQELIVPSLFFPVKSTSNNEPLWVQNVVVPLAKDLLDQAKAQRPILY